MDVEAVIGDDIIYRLYVKDLSLALSVFESAREWPDLIDALQKLSKVFENAAFAQFRLIPAPSMLLLSKRLAQCLSPGLPDGVHLKALQIYTQIFTRLTPALLIRDLPFYSAGLFQLLQHGTDRVQTTLLTLFETHYLGLGASLLPACSGLVCALLPSLTDSHEEPQEHGVTQRVLLLLNRLRVLCGTPAFINLVWRLSVQYPSLRLSCLRLVSLSLPTEGPKDEFLPHDATSQALQVALADTNQAVARLALDLLLVSFPAEQHFSALLNLDSLLPLLVRAVSLIERKDASLLRRLYAWLLPPSSSSPSSSPPVLPAEPVYSSSTCVELVRAALLCMLRTQLVHQVIPASENAPTSNNKDHHNHNNNNPTSIGLASLQHATDKPFTILPLLLEKGEFRNSSLYNSLHIPLLNHLFCCYYCDDYENFSNVAVSDSSLGRDMLRARRRKKTGIDLAEVVAFYITRDSLPVNDLTPQMSIWQSLLSELTKLSFDFLIPPQEIKSDVSSSIIASSLADSSSSSFFPCSLAGCISLLELIRFACMMFYATHPDSATCLRTGEDSLCSLFLSLFSLLAESGRRREDNLFVECGVTIIQIWELSKEYYSSFSSLLSTTSSSSLTSLSPSVLSYFDHLFDSACNSQSSPFYVTLSLTTFRLFLLISSHSSLEKFLQQITDLFMRTQHDMVAAVALSNWLSVACAGHPKSEITSVIMQDNAQILSKLLLVQDAQIVRSLKNVIFSPIAASPSMPSLQTTVQSGLQPACSRLWAMQEGAQAWEASQLLKSVNSLYPDVVEAFVLAEWSTSPPVACRRLCSFLLNQTAFPCDFTTLLLSSSSSSSSYGIFGRPILQLFEALASPNGCVRETAQAWLLQSLALNFSQVIHPITQLLLPSPSLASESRVKCLSMAVSTLWQMSQCAPHVFFRSLVTSRLSSDVAVSYREWTNKKQISTNRRNSVTQGKSVSNNDNNRQNNDHMNEEAKVVIHAVAAQGEYFSPTTSYLYMLVDVLLHFLCHESLVIFQEQPEHESLKPTCVSLLESLFGCSINGSDDIGDTRNYAILCLLDTLKTNKASHVQIPLLSVLKPLLASSLAIGKSPPFLASLLHTVPLGLRESLEEAARSPLSSSVCLLRWLEILEACLPLLTPSTPDTSSCLSLCISHLCDALKFLCRSSTFSSTTTTFTATSALSSSCWFNLRITLHSLCVVLRFCYRVCVSSQSFHFMDFLPFATINPQKLLFGSRSATPTTTATVASTTTTTTTAASSLLSIVPTFAYRTTPSTIVSATSIHTTISTIPSSTTTTAPTSAFASYTQPSSTQPNRLIAESGMGDVCNSLVMVWKALEREPREETVAPECKEIRREMFALIGELLSESPGVCMDSFVLLWHQRCISPTSEPSSLIHSLLLAAVAPSISSRALTSIPCLASPLTGPLSPLVSFATHEVFALGFFDGLLRAGSESVSDGENFNLTVNFVRKALTPGTHPILLLWLLKILTSMFTRIGTSEPNTTNNNSVNSKISKEGRSIIPTLLQIWNSNMMSTTAIFSSNSITEATLLPPLPPTSPPSSRRTSIAAPTIVTPPVPHDNTATTSSDTSSITTSAPNIIPSTTSTPSLTTSTMSMAPSLVSSTNLAVRCFESMSYIIPSLIVAAYGASDQPETVACVTSIWPVLSSRLKCKDQVQEPVSGVLACLCQPPLRGLSRGWIKEAWSHFLSPNFFRCTLGSLLHWKTIVSFLVTEERSLVPDLLERCTAQGGGLLSFRGGGHAEKAALFKRLSFVVFCGRNDQFVSRLGSIIDKLGESLRLPDAPLIQAEALFCFRVLALRISSQQLHSVWSLACLELIRVFQTGSRSASVMLAACKLLDFALISLPHDFPMYQWIFIQDALLASGNKEMLFEPYVDKLARKISERLSTNVSISVPSSYVPMGLVRGRSKLAPYFGGGGAMDESKDFLVDLMHFHEHVTHSSCQLASCEADSKTIEEWVLQDFLEDSVNS